VRASGTDGCSLKKELGVSAGTTRRRMTDKERQKGNGGALNLILDGGFRGKEGKPKRENHDAIRESKVGVKPCAGLTERGSGLGLK